MDPHRHHEYLAGSEERTRPMYITQGAEPRGVQVAVAGSLDDVRSPHQQYYTSNRDLLAKKPARYGCTCNGSNTMCNGCRAANTTTTTMTMARPTEESWASTPSSTRQSPIYINTNPQHHMSNSNNSSISGSSSATNSRSSSYWPPEEHAIHSRGVAGTTPTVYMDTRKPPLVQSSYPAYKSAPLSTTTITQTTRPSAIKHYPSKERFYEENKYAMPSVVAATPNTKIPNYATPVAIYDVDGLHRPLEHPIQCSSVRSEHIINPSNALAPSEQQPSPNYARKCPQIYAPSLAPEQHATSHQSLYMATPQFSSEKFQTIAQSAIQKYTRASPQDHQMGSPATAVEFRGSGMLESAPRIRESSPQPITHSAAYRVSNHKYLEQEPHLTVRPATFVTSATTGGTSVNYHHHLHTEPGGRNAELTPVIMKSTPLAPASHYVQYSKSPLPQTAQYSTSGPELRRDKVNYMKLDSDPVTPSSNHSTIASSRGLYHNPYKTPPPTDNSCCKERASPYNSSPVHSYRGETPHGYPTKYSKLVQESNSMHKLTHHAHTPPPALQATSHISRPHATSAATSRSHSASSSYYYGAQSPATASAASPSPQMHHAVYTPTPPPPSSSSTIPPPPPSAPIVVTQTSHGYTHPQLQQQAPVIMPQGYTPGGDICCSTVSLVPKAGVTPSGKQPIPPAKKPQTAKPNYRILINELMLRNTASEEELNMQIIKKALNVNAPQPVVRVPNNTTSVVVPIKPTQPTPGVIHQQVAQPSTAPLAPMPNTNHVISTTTSIIVPQIKQELTENKPASHSPLDLSMRTVKTKADSTECKIRQKNSVDYKHGLPRIDITPNFSAATVAQRLSTPPTVPSRLDQQAYTPPVKEHSQSSTIYNQESYSHHYKTPQSGTGSIIQCPSNSLVIKSTPRQQDITHSQCARPSVLVEPNSYSKFPAASTRQMLAVEQLPPDTSIVVLPKPTHIQHQPNVQPTSNRTVPPPVPLISDQVHPLRSKQPTTQSAYVNNNLVHSEQLNPNYLGRKRHLQEYSNSNNKYNNNNNNNNNTQEPYNKQPRHMSPMPHIVTTPQLPRATEIPVIAINEHALELERKRANENLIEVGLSKSNSFHNDLPVSVTVSTICKQEPLTPTGDSVPSPLPSSPAPPPPAPIKAERIRTKAELKGFTFNPPPMADSSTNQTQAQIKIEPDVSAATQADVPIIAGLTDEYNSHSLLDIGWNNTCNSFVEQLLTNSEKRQQQQPLQMRDSAIVAKATTVSSASDIKQELSEDDLPVAFIAQKKLNNESLEKLLPEIVVSTTTPPSVLLQKKLSKLDREKKRLVQEQRLAARLPDGSSSESDNELDKRKSERQKKPLRKGKTRRLQLEKSDKINESSERAFYTSSELTDVKSDKVPTTKHEQIFKTDEEKAVVKSDKCESDESKTDERFNKSDTVISTNNKDKVNKVQYSESSKNCFKSMVTDEKQRALSELKPSKHLANKKLQNKIALNTMTRSKRKKELELQLANSKVLRNDKIIRNSTTKIKRKYVRKMAAVKEATKDVNVIGTRLRARKSNELPLNGRKLKPGAAACSSKAESEHNLKATAKSRKIQQQQDLYLEMYRFKRALKIPPSLITVENMNHHKIAASLPDLERGNALEELTGFKNTTRRKPKTQLRKSNKQGQESEAAPKSIIDVLHSRVTNSVTSSNKLSTTTTTTASSKAPSVVQNFSETSQNTESTSVYELPLPTPVKRPEEDFDVKRHFSIFDTKVLQSKTRTESKMQQKREIIREIFVGPDRPASAPPDMPRGDEISGVLDGGEFCTGDAFISYEKCEQFLEQMNRIIRQNKSKFTRVGSSALSSSLNIKKEDLDDGECADEKDDNVINHTNNTPGAHLHKRKYLRRKGSSGFDYIRKKKKPTNHSAQANSNGLSVSMHNLHPAQTKIEKIEEDIDLDKTKTEDDVCREIQKWVLNKGVGQSTMHKAARQGYIDVVVYCLDRLGMNPNQKDNAGYTPLHEACTHGWLEIARILLQFGANHSEAAQAGIRPLHGAIENDHDEVVRLLLSYGADPLLATYSGQTPLTLASSKVMRGILNAHLSDAQSTANLIQPMRFPGPWEIFDSTEYGYDIFDNVPNIACDMSRALLRKRRSRDSIVLTSNGFTNKLPTTNTASTSNNISNGENGTKTATTTKTEGSAEDGNECNSDLEPEHKPNENELIENFEFEETDVLLPPLYLLKDEGSDKWVLLNDLCNLLKVKSKDTLLNKICPGSTSTSTMALAHKNLLREYKMSDFLEKATCMQLLCAGEKLNIGASKVVLIKYNESVKNLLGVKTILMKF